MLIGDGFKSVHQIWHHCPPAPSVNSSRRKMNWQVLFWENLQGVSPNLEFWMFFSGTYENGSEKGGLNWKTGFAKKKTWKRGSLLSFLGQKINMVLLASWAFTFFFESTLGLHLSQRGTACLAGLRPLKKQLRLRLLKWSGFSGGVGGVLENVWQNSFTC